MLSAEHQAVVDALATLPPRQREVLVLRYYGGLTTAEIAAELGCATGSVGPWIDRALTYLENDPARLKGFAWLLFNLDEFIYIR